MKNSKSGGHIIATVILLYWNAHISKTSQEFTDRDYDELLLGDYKEENQKGRIFFGNNGSIILDNRTTLILAALFGPFLVALPLLLLLLNKQGGDEEKPYGYVSSSGYGGGHGGSGGEHGYERHYVVKDVRKQHHSYGKRSAPTDSESSGKYLSLYFVMCSSDYVFVVFYSNQMDNWCSSCV